jgi:hypothetical protein
MSESNAASSREAALQDAKRQREIFAAEQRALGKVNVSGWIPKDMVPGVRRLLDGISAGDTSFLPERVAELDQLREAGPELARLRQTLDLAEREVERRQDQLTRFQQELAASQAEIAAAQAEAMAAAEQLAAETQRRSLLESQVADAVAELAGLRETAARLGQSGLRPMLARLLLP